jgi:hypothetical protein
MLPLQVAPLTHKNLVLTIFTTYFNILKLLILPTDCVCVLRMVLTIESDYFPKQH